MCRLAAERRGRASRRAGSRCAAAGPSYTADTLSEIHASHPEAELTFVMGADTALTLPGWRDPGRVLELARLAVARRPGSDGARGARCAVGDRRRRSAASCSSRCRRSRRPPRWHASGSPPGSPSAGWWRPTVRELHRRATASTASPRSAARDGLRAARRRGFARWPPTRRRTTSSSSTCAACSATPTGSWSAPATPGARRRRSRTASSRA